MKQLTKTELAVLAGKSVYHSLRAKSVSDGMGKTERALKASTNTKLGKRVTTRQACWLSFSHTNT